MGENELKKQEDYESNKDIDDVREETQTEHEMPQKENKKNKETPTDIFCPKCGAKLSEDQEYCHKCGQKIGEPVTDVVGDTNIGKHRKFVPIAVIVCIVIAIAGILVYINNPAIENIELESDSLDMVIDESTQIAYKIEPVKAQRKKVEWGSSDRSVAIVDKNGRITAVGVGTCVITVASKDRSDAVNITVKSLFDSYLDQYDYENAYKVAENEEEKEFAIYENRAAIMSANAANGLKDRSSFVLTEAYVYEPDSVDDTQTVLRITGNNSFGAPVSGYWLYAWDDIDETWEYLGAVYNLEEETPSEYDSDERIYEIFYDNVIKKHIKEGLENGEKLDKKSIDRINEMFGKGVLDEVTWISNVG